MSKMSQESRLEILAKLREQYKASDLASRGVLLDTCVNTLGYHRKYAIALMKRVSVAPKRRQRKRIYGSDVQNLVIWLWDKANQICPKRLTPFLPELVASLEAHGQLVLDSELRKKLLSASESTIERMLAPERKTREKRLNMPAKRRKRGSNFNIPTRTHAEDREVVDPGSVETDCVSHCGGLNFGSFLRTLTYTDIFSSWTEFYSLENKEEGTVAAGLSSVADSSPFITKSLDTDNGPEFINFVVNEWCSQRKILRTRSRPYTSNDQAHVEQKNGSIVRQFIGHDRYSGSRDAVAMNRFYASLRLYVNFFQPSMKLISSERINGKVRKRYDVAKTPYRRLLESNISETTKDQLKQQFEKIDLVELKNELDLRRDELWQRAKITHRASSNNLVEQVIADGDRVRKRVRKPKVAHESKATPKDSDGILQVDSTATDQVLKVIYSLQMGEIVEESRFREYANSKNIHRILQNQVRAGKLAQHSRGKYMVISHCERALKFNQQMIERIVNSSGPFRTSLFDGIVSKKHAADVLGSLKRRGLIEKVAHGLYRKVEEKQ